MNDASTVDELRNQLVDEILGQHSLPPAVEHALRTVRRDAHLPGLDPADAYTNNAVTIKENPDGPLALSCASVPSTVAMMLAQLDAQPGDHVLEIGAGTGYNAALLSEIVGPTGEVTTVDIDADVALHARQALNRTGYEHVRVIERDGLVGAPEHAPYNRIIGTVGFWDVPAALRQQLAEGGRLVLPLRWRGQTRSVAFHRRGETLTSDGMELCGFVPIIGQDGERIVELADGIVRLHHDQDQGIDSEQLAEVFASPETIEWADVRVGRQEPFDGLWLRITAFEDTICRIEVTKQALARGVRRPVIPVRSPALVEGDSLAYLIAERDDADAERPVRLGAVGYGSYGTELARRMVAHITAWSPDRTAVPRLSIYPGKSSDRDLPAGHSFDKRESRVVISYEEDPRRRA
ncbi:methyltransferase, FxLD system [Streptomyces sp. NPDC050732]|uniref:methyltransferase, FxLD system n=1 Tax=Streptomyces sp. NPDC050732 TaxID=3154632 RepID=UPI003426C3E2